MLVVCAMVAWLAVAAVTVQAAESIRVNIPRSLAANYPNGVPERPAMFGVPSFASSLSGRLIWGTPGDRDGCTPIDKTSVTWPLGPVILLVDRGSCTFVTKVRNAEAAGAVACIVVDNVDEPGLPYMADDGTGKNIAIPSALIHKNDGQAFKDVVGVNSTGIVTVTMSWSLPRPDNRVEYDLWSSSVDEQSRGFKNVFAVADNALGMHAKFTPRYFILKGEDYGCTAAGQPCGNQCTNQGHYCAVDPEHDLSVGLSGADVVEENLAQLCLYDYINRTDCEDSAWWKYVYCFQTECYPAPPAVNHWNQTCKNMCLTRAGIDPAEISQCVQDKGGLTSTYNSFLANEITWRETLGVFYLPTLFVNLTPYRGNLQCPVPLDTAHCGPLAMICEGYLEGTRPTACSSSPGCAPGIFMDGCGVCGGKNESCADCAGKPYGAAVSDGKGGCCLASQVDCSNTCFGRNVTDKCNVCGGKGGDACGICRLPGDPSYMDPKEGGLDVCGSCLRFVHPAFNNSGCVGCDGVPRSGKNRDVCGNCGGSETDPAKCAGAASSIGVGAIVGIVVACVALAGLGVFFYMRRQQNVLKNDIDSLLKQYLPLDAANSLAHPTSRDDGLIPDGSRSDAPTSEL